jgi:predicted acyl esterase
MFSEDWAVSDRAYSPVRETGISVPLSDGNTLDADIVRPESNERHPAILSVHAYDKRDQAMPLHPVAFSHRRGHIEAGDSAFFARRGYVHVILNIRGTGDSSGTYDNLGPRSIEDLREAIDWLAAQPWCSGRVGMFGISFFALVQPRVAERAPEPLKAIFAPFGYTDMYRDRYFHGGILSHKFMEMWLPTLHKPRLAGFLRDAVGDAEFDRLLAAARGDDELRSVPFLSKVLSDPEAGPNGLIADILLQPLDGDYYRERSVDYTADCSVPAYFGACWGVYGLHLPGALRSYENWKGPKKLTIGPPVYLDRPFYQYHLEALRWFDHWLKDNDTGMMEEPDINLFVTGTGRWKQAAQWPVPQTRFTRFYLHEAGELSEREYRPEEGATSFEDSPYKRGQVEFWTADFVEETELAGPIALNLYGKTTDTEVLWFASLLHRDAEGAERILTRGWLRGSQRATDPDRSRPWQPYHPHDRRDPVTPGEPTLFEIEMRPYAIALKPGERLGLRIKCADDEPPANTLEVISMGHMARPSGARVTVLHDEDHPSHLILPVTAGNRIGTFVSGGHL